VRALLPLFLGLPALWAQAIPATNFLDDFCRQPANRAAMACSPDLMPRPARASAPRRTTAPKRSVAPVVTLPALTLADGDLLRFAHDKPALLLGLNVRSIVDSSMVKSLMGQFVPLAGAPGLLESLRQVEQVHVSIGTEAPGQMDVVVLVTGDFTRGIPEFLRESSMRLFRVNAHTLIAGEAGGARAAYARLRNKTRPVPASAAGDLWLVADASLLPPGTAPAELRDVRRVNAGINLQDGVSFDVSLLTTSPAAAARLLDAVRAKMKELPSAEGMEEQFELSADGATARLRASVTQAQLEAGLGRELAGTFNRPAPAAAATPMRKAVIHGQ
jgi:hypothetical protein